MDASDDVNTSDNVNASDNVNTSDDVNTSYNVNTSDMWTQARYTIQSLRHTTYNCKNKHAVTTVAMCR